MLINFAITGVAIAVILQSLAIRSLLKRIEELDVAVTARCTVLNATCHARHQSTKENQ